MLYLKASFFKIMWYWCVINHFFTSRVPNILQFELEAQVGGWGGEGALAWELVLILTPPFIDCPADLPNLFHHELQLPHL